jgi:hypothetical protein
MCFQIQLVPLHLGDYPYDVDDPSVGLYKLNSLDPIA